MIKTLLFFFLFFHSAIAYNNDIVASVNNFAITKYDLNNLRKLFNTKGPVLEDYILLIKKRFIAINNNVTLTKEEENSLKSQKNAFLKSINANSNGVDNDFIYFIIESNYLWSKYIELFVKPTIIIQDSYIDNVIEYMANTNSKTKYDLSEIVLYYNKDNKEKVEGKIQDIFLTLNEENFNSMAKSLSQSLSAKNGGNIGWVFESDLNSNVIDIIRNTDSISKPACIGDLSGVCIIFKINDIEKIYNVSNELRGEIKNFIFLQLLESKVSNIINTTNFVIKYDYNK